MTGPVGLVVMGVSGSGKTAVGRRAADRLGWAFLDADDLHPPANVAKMEKGTGLADADRAPWLAAVHESVEAHLAAERSVVVACSALKEAYRDRLRGGDPRVRFVWLDVPEGELRARLERREGHFAGADLLPSQLEALEPPGSGEAVRVAAAGPLAATVAEVVEAARR